MQQLLSILKHIVLWAFLILFLIDSNWDWQGFSTKAGTITIPILYGMAFNIGLFYLNVFYLYPSYWRNSKLRYWVLAVVLVIAASMIEGWIDLLYASANDLAWSSYQDLELPAEGDTNYRFILFSAYSISNSQIHVLYWVLSFAYLLPQANVRNIKLENERLQAELKYLKAQIEPHTLFNGINGIYHLMDEDVSQAKEYLLGFSNILRYHIYSGQEELIPIRKEIEFLAHYFQLAQLRIGEDAVLEWQFEQPAKDFLIAPLLFYPFAENAIKHLSMHDDPQRNRLLASITFEHKQVHFKIENTFLNAPTVDQKAGGLGLKNIKERLKLTYPSKHLLDIYQEKDTYFVHLTLSLYAKTSLSNR